MNNLVFTVLITIAAVTRAHEIETPNAEQYCPWNSYGEFPNCICTSGEPFNEIYNICPTQLLDSLGGSCPYDSTGKSADGTALTSTAFPVSLFKNRALCGSMQIVVPRYAFQLSN